jgi:hypothetical protein
MYRFLTATDLLFFEAVMIFVVTIAIHIKV